MPWKESLTYGKTVNEILRLQIILIHIRCIYLTAEFHEKNTCHHTTDSMAESQLSSVIPPTPLLWHQKISLHPYSKTTRKTIYLLEVGEWNQFYTL